MPPDLDPGLEQIHDLMFVCLRDRLISGEGWMSVQSLASRVCCDQSLIVGIANLSTDFLLDKSETKIRLKPDMQGHPPDPFGHFAAKAVRDYAAQLAPIVLGINAVKAEGSVLGFVLHRITVESKDNEDDSDLSRLAVETPLEIRKKSEKSLAKGYVVGFSKHDDLSLWIALDRQLLKSDLPCKICVDRSIVWQNLAHQLDLIKTKPANYSSLMEQAPSPLADTDSTQLAMGLVEHPAGSSKLLWGPPGSGKTHCLATAAVRLALSETAPILITALSNSAVDAAAKAVLKILKENPSGMTLLAKRQVVRAGYTRDRELLATNEMFGSEDLEALTTRIQDLHRKLAQASADGLDEQTKAELSTELLQRQKERRKALCDHIKQAKIVLATFAGVVDPHGPFVEDHAWSAVFADEVSMLGRAAALFLSNLSHNWLLLAGDPQQLPPIVEWSEGNPTSDVKKWLGTEPFEFTGLVTVQSSKATVAVNDGRLMRLLSQRRCHKGIWKLVSGRYPDVETLVDDATVNVGARVPPAPGSPVVIVDVTGAASQDDLPTADAVSVEAMDDRLALSYASACRKNGRSWRNPPTAALALDLALEAAAADSSPSVAVITPYRAQVRYLNLLLEHRSTLSLSNRGKSSSKILIGTVHAFQGSEADVVVLDLVDGPPRIEPGVLLTGETGERLLNVAITRAKGKLIVIACLKWCKEKLPGGLLRGLLFGEHAQSKVVVDSPEQSWADQEDEAEPKPESPIEEIFKAELDRRKLTHELQYRIKDARGRIVARADFAFPSQRVAVFCDGLQYHHNPERWSRDIKQGRILKLLGWDAVRFTGAEINSNAVACVAELKRFLDGVQ